MRRLAFAALAAWLFVGGGFVAWLAFTQLWALAHAFGF